MTTGTKTVRIYVRTPSVSSGGGYVFARITLTQAYFPTAIFSMTGAALVNYTDRVYMLETTIEADENVPINLKLEWLGNYDLIIDKIVIKSDASPDHKEYSLNAVETGGSHVVTIDGDTAAGVTAIDYFRMKMDGVSILMPATEIIEWLVNHEKVEIILGTPAA